MWRRSRCSRKLLLFVLVAVTWFGGARELFARELAWRGPPECDQAVTVSEQVEAITGRSLAAIDDYEFAVSIEVTAGPTFHLVLVTKARGAASASERRFQGTGCSEVSDAAAVAIAMTLQSPPPEPDEAPSPEPAPSPVAEPETPAPTRSRRDASAVRPSRDDSRDTIEAHAGLAGLFETGTLPGAGLGGALGAGLTWHPVRLELQGALLAPRTSETLQGRGGEFELALAAALGCYERRFGGPRGLACLGYEIGSLSGEGFGVSAPRLGSVLWQAVRAELGTNLRLSETLWLSLRAGAAIPLARRAFVLDAGEVVHRSSAISARAQAGFEVSL